MKFLAIALLLTSCATPSSTEPPAEEPLTCAIANGLNSYEASKLYDEYVELVGLQHEIASAIEAQVPAPDQTDVDEAWGSLGQSIGELRVLCACSDYVVNTPECAEWHDVMEQLFD